VSRWPGTWKVVCDRCGFWFHSDELRKEWQGLMTCNSCWEPRHPQDFVRGVPDHTAPPWTRPEPEDVFREVDYVLPLSCTIAGTSGVSGIAVAGCAIAGRRLESLNVP
jgi:hypothetical protein